MKVSIPTLALICGMVAWLASRTVDGGVGAASNHKGFDVSNAIVPADQIVSGGPPPDGIPSIDKPKFMSQRMVSYLQENDEVLSVTLGGETRAYPLRILVWHEIVNDQIKGVPIAVTYCPLCGTAMAFSREVEGRKLTFGVSGLLYQSDVLMFDRETRSLWSQLGTQSVAGKLVGATLEWIPTEQMTWKSWQQKYPGSKVLSILTGSARNYSSQPYADYETNPQVMFPVPTHRTELPEKAWVLGTIVNGEAKAYPLAQMPPREGIRDVLGDVEIIVAYDPVTRHATVQEAETGELIPSVKVYWFAWQAFYPQTRLW